jgi:hypothetical protein
MALTTAIKAADDSVTLTSGTFAKSTNEINMQSVNATPVNQYRATMSVLLIDQIFAVVVMAFASRQF